MSTWTTCDEANIPDSSASVPITSQLTDDHHNVLLESGPSVTENYVPMTQCGAAVAENGTIFILASSLGDGTKWSNFATKVTDSPVKTMTVNSEETHQELPSGQTELAVCTASKDCKRMFFDEKYLHIHQKKAHKPKAESSGGLPCLFRDCGRTFQYPSHLKYHLLSHRNERAFECVHPGCGRSFLTSQRLHVHMRTHSGVKPFVCSHPNCSKSFTTNGNLVNHMRVHTGEKPFVCDTCSKRFAEKSTLKKHSAVHTGKKLYVCEYCKREFSQSSSLNVHMKKSHLDELPLRQTTKSSSVQQVTDATVSSAPDTAVVQNTSTSCVDTAVHQSKTYTIALLPSSNPGTAVALLPQNPEQKMDGTNEKHVDEYHVLGPEDKLQSEDIREHYLDFENCILTTQDKLTSDLVSALPSKTDANVVVLSQPKHFPDSDQQGSSLQQQPLSLL